MAHTNIHKCALNKKEKKKKSLHHGHGDLLEISFDIPHVGERLSTEYDSKPRA